MFPSRFWQNEPVNAGGNFVMNNVWPTVAGFVQSGSSKWIQANQNIQSMNMINLSLAILV